MPTIFTECDECFYHSSMKMSHIFNKPYRENLEKNDILINLGLPPEISQKIIKLSYNIETCDYCIQNKTKLCNYHVNRAKGNSYYYRNSINKKMCDQCCWWEVS